MYLNVSSPLLMRREADAPPPWLTAVSLPSDLA
jgi:hypothetical protein